MWYIKYRDIYLKHYENKALMKKYKVRHISFYFTGALKTLFCCPKEVCQTMGRGDDQSRQDDRGVGLRVICDMLKVQLLYIFII